MATVLRPAPALLSAALQPLTDVLVEAGDLTLFAVRVLLGAFWPPRRANLTPIFYFVGVRSVPVVMVTGAFIGMVLAVQSYSQFAELGMATRLGVIVNYSVVRELGPVLAATMLAGRVGSAMAAEIATMRVTEQIDALACLGANPLRHLVVPRFLACMLLIPLLTIVANFMGVMGGALISVKVYHIDAHYYWSNAEGHIGLYDIFTGLIKPTFFGAAIAILSCYRGFNSEAGAEGVGQAATRAFVLSFIAILALDFFLAMFFYKLYYVVWPGGGGGVLLHEFSREPRGAAVSSGVSSGARSRGPRPNEIWETHDRDSATTDSQARDAPNSSRTGIGAIRRTARAARHRLCRGHWPDGMRHRRKRLRQDGTVETHDRPAAADHRPD